MTKKYSFNQYGDGKAERHEPVAVTMENGFAKLVDGEGYSQAEQFGAGDCKELLLLLVENKVNAGTSMLWIKDVKPDIKGEAVNSKGVTYTVAGFSPELVKSMLANPQANLTLYDTKKKVNEGKYKSGIKIYLTFGKEAEKKAQAPTVISRKPTPPAQPQMLKRKQ